MLELGKQDAARLILGAAYSYELYVRFSEVRVSSLAFADAHSAPMQRYYNLLCISYGAAPDLFGGLVEQGYLPRSRAGSCRIEFSETKHAFQTTIVPHLDPVLAKQVMDATWVPTPGKAVPPGNVTHKPDARSPGR